MWGSWWERNIPKQPGPGARSVDTPAQRLLWLITQHRGLSLKRLLMCSARTREKVIACLLHWKGKGKVCRASVCLGVRFDPKHNTTIGIKQRGLQDQLICDFICGEGLMRNINQNMNQRYLPPAPSCLYVLQGPGQAWAEQRLIAPGSGRASALNGMGEGGVKRFLPYPIGDEKPLKAFKYLSSIKFKKKKEFRDLLSRVVK